MSEERKFLSRLNDEGEINPELLTQDPVLIEKIRNFPGLLWKTQNVRQFKNQSKG
jgi:hypothetical protein